MKIGKIRKKYSRKSATVLLLLDNTFSKSNYFLFIFTIGTNFTPVRSNQTKEMKELLLDLQKPFSLR